MLTQTEADEIRRIVKKFQAKGLIKIAIKPVTQQYTQRKELPPPPGTLADKYPWKKIKNNPTVAGRELVTRWHEN